MRRKTTAFFAILIIVIVAILAPVTSALADTAYYVSLGADLTEDERAAVMELMDVTEDKLDQDTMVIVTNEDEHRYLDSVIDSSLIGSKALSSCKVVQRESGYGIHVVTYNITGISEGMFRNALATAGVEDADVVVAAPFPISGTAGLLGVMQAYSKMKGTVLQADLIEAATSELITTSEISELLGDSAATEQLIALAKQVIADRDLSDESEIRAVVTDIAAELGYALDENEMSLAVNLMKRLSSADLDASALAEQMEAIYSAAVSSGIDLSQFGIDQSLIDRAKEEMPGIMSGLLDWFGSAFE
ncbi:MAG: DUF1002 domain-containing protein [Lachnospiraceae bacterium]|nr:DUF1002 domain-containing protein [Lachnospiraceae bacterium]